MDKNYKMSNAKTEIKGRIKVSTKKKFQQLREKDILTSEDLKGLADSICEDLKLPKVPRVSFAYQQPSTKRTVTKGIIKCLKFADSVEASTIIVYQRTAKRNKIVASKAALGTLLHELTHHYNYQALKLEKSVHTAGFYKRISNLKNKLL